LDAIDVWPAGGCREPFSSVSHLLGAAAFAAATIALLPRARGDWGRWLSLAVMALGTIGSLTLSGLYHAAWPGPWRDWLVRVDIAGIFFLVSASLTPVHMILFQGAGRWWPLGLYWLGTTLGITWRMSYFEQVSGPYGIGILMLFGWGTALSAYAVGRRYGWRFVRPGVCAGLCYSVGATLLLLKPPALWPGVISTHEIWHGLVLIGLTCHWSFVFQFAGGVSFDEPRILAFPIREAVNLHRAA
jgi:hemolysin III